MQRVGLHVRASGRSANRDGGCGCGGLLGLGGRRRCRCSRGRRLCLGAGHAVQTRPVLGHRLRRTGACRHPGGRCRQLTLATSPVGPQALGRERLRQRHDVVPRSARGPCGCHAMPWCAAACFLPSCRMNASCGNRCSSRPSEVDMCVISAYVPSVAWIAVVLPVGSEVVPPTRMPGLASKQVRRERVVRQRSQAHRASRVCFARSCCR